MDSRDCLAAAVALVEVVTARIDVRDERRVAGMGATDSHTEKPSQSAEIQSCGSHDHSPTA